MTAANRKLRIWVIDPSLSHPETQGVAEVLRDWPGESRLFRPALAPGDGPAPGTGYDTDCVVLLGSAASVHDRLPWIEDLSVWLRPVLAGEVRLPLLAICFGHQLVAHLAGGKVEFMQADRAKRVGVERSRLDGCRLLDGREDLRVVVSHRESVTEPPPGYRVVATRPGVPVDGLEHETLPIFAFQFHPEAREEFAVRAGIAPADLDPRLRDDTRRLLAAFREEVSPRLDPKKRAGG